MALETGTYLANGRRRARDRPGFFFRLGKEPQSSRTGREILASDAGNTRERARRVGARRRAVDGGGLHEHTYTEEFEEGISRTHSRGVPLFSSGVLAGTLKNTRFFERLAARESDGGLRLKRTSGVRSLKKGSCKVSVFALWKNQEKKKKKKKTEKKFREARELRASARAGADCRDERNSKRCGCERPLTARPLHAHSQPAIPLSKMRCVEEGAFFFFSRFPRRARSSLEREKKKKNQVGLFSTAQRCAHFYSPHSFDLSARGGERRVGGDAAAARRAAARARAVPDRESPLVSTREKRVFLSKELVWTPGMRRTRRSEVRRVPGSRRARARARARRPCSLRVFFFFFKVPCV